MIPECLTLRLKECGSTTLEARRLRGGQDQIEVLKILNGYENIDSNVVFSLKKYSRARGHEVTLMIKDLFRFGYQKVLVLTNYLNNFCE